MTLHARPVPVTARVTNALVTTGCQVMSPQRHHCCRTTEVNQPPSRKTSIEMFRHSTQSAPGGRVRCALYGRPAIVAATACVALLTAACSSGSAHPGVAQLPANGSTGSGAPAAVGTAKDAASPLAHAECMRSHGVPDFPDPGPIHIDVSAHPDLDPTSPTFVAAQKECVSLEPGGTTGNGVTPAMQAAALAYSACMRTHGFPKFADPVFDSSGEHVAINGIDTDGAQFLNADKTCQTSSGLAKLSGGTSAGTGP
jgi:hypothetical protein